MGRRGLAIRLVTIQDSQSPESVTIISKTDTSIAQRAFGTRVVGHFGVFSHSPRRRAPTFRRPASPYELQSSQLPPYRRSRQQTTRFLSSQAKPAHRLSVCDAPPAIPRHGFTRFDYGLLFLSRNLFVLIGRTGERLAAGQQAPHKTTSARYLEAAPDRKSRRRRSVAGR